MGGGMVYAAPAYRASPPRARANRPPRSLHVLSTPLKLSLAALPCLLLTACFSTTWVKAGATEAETEAMLARCEAYAEEQVDDFAATIADTQVGVAAGREDFGLRDDLRAYDDRYRRSDLVESCMRQHGYRDAGDVEEEIEEDEDDDKAEPTNV